MTVTILHAQDALKALTFSGHFYVPAELLQDTEQSSLIVRIDGVDGTSADPIIHWLLARGGILFQSKNASSGPGSDSLAIMGKRNLFLSLFSDYTPESISVSEVISQIASGIPDGTRSIPYRITCNDRILHLNKRTHVMGILNVTPDSFHDGGKFAKKERALARAVEMAGEGADIIDIGGESSRPGATPVTAEEEMSRTIPVIEAVRAAVPTPISIDTTKSVVAEAALGAGADMINDISGMTEDAEMARIAARYDVPVILMHMKGTPATMQQKPRYEDIIIEIRQVLYSYIQNAIRSGISRNKIIIDPGIGFGKEWPDNFTILNRLEAFTSLGCPILIGISRKSCIGWALGDKNEDRLAGSLSAVSASILNGAHIVRVHDVRETVQAARIADCIRGSHGSG